MGPVSSIAIAGYVTVHVRLVLVGNIDVTFHITIVIDPEVSSAGTPLLDCSPGDSEALIFGVVDS